MSVPLPDLHPTRYSESGSPIQLPIQRKIGPGAKTGDTVRHKTHGLGRITEVQSDGKYTVEWETGVSETISPNNKNCSRVASAKQAPSRSKKKSRRGGKTPEKSSKQGSGKSKTLKKPEARKLVRKAPQVMTEAETQALLAATEMGNAATPELAVSSSAKAGVAADAAAGEAEKLSVMRGKVSAFEDLAEQVSTYEAAALAAAEAARAFAVQAKRLADVVEAQAKAVAAASKEEAETLALQQARELSEGLALEIEYLLGYLVAFDTDMPNVGGSDYEPNEDLGASRLKIVAEIAQARFALQQNQQAIAVLEQSVASLGTEHEHATEDVTAKTLGAEAGSAGLAETEASIKATRELRALAGGELYLAALRTLPKFSENMAALKTYLTAVDGKGLAKAKKIRLVTDLSATHSAVELGTLATSIAGGVDIAVAVALARLEPKLAVEIVTLFGEVQAEAECVLQIIVDLLPLHAVPLYATEEVLTELAELAEEEVSASRMAGIVLDQNTLAKDDLVTLTELFEDYSTNEEMIVLAKAVTEGMQSGRGASDVVKLIEDLKEGGVAVPPATTVKHVLQAAHLSGFTIPQIRRLMTALAALTGEQMVQVGTWLRPLSAASILKLVGVFVADGTSAANIHATFQVMNAARLNGARIREKVEYLRGYIAAPGGARNAEVTEVGGTKILTGPEIHAHVLNALSGQNPRNKVGNLKKYPKGEDPTTRNVDNLWGDVNPATRGDETAEEGVRRQKLALAELCKFNGYDRAILQQIARVGFGAAPRAIDTPSIEDARDPANEAHVNDKHTIGGGGTVNTYYNLAGRACFSPSAGGQASAFRSPDDAKAAIQATLDAYVARPGNWCYLRSRLVRGGAIAIDEPVGAARGVWLRTTGGGGPNGLYDLNSDYTYHQHAKPWWDGGYGGRPYFDGDNKVIPNGGGFVRRSSQPNAAIVRYGEAGEDAPNSNRVRYEPDTPLTEVIAGTGVHLRLVGANCRGGFVVNSAYLYE